MPTAQGLRQEFCLGILKILRASCKKSFFDLFKVFDNVDSNAAQGG